MKQATKRKKQANALSMQINRRLREGAFIMLSSLSIYICIALIGFDAADPGWSHAGMSENVVNAAGLTGALIADVLLSLFGYIAYLIPVGLLTTGWMIYRDGVTVPQFDPLIWVMRFLGFIVAIIAICGLTSMHVPWHTLPMSAGGVLGAIVQSQSVGYLNYAGASVILLACALAGTTLFSGLSWLKLVDWIGRGVVQFVRKVIPFKRLKEWRKAFTKKGKEWLVQPPLLRLMAPKVSDKKQEVITLPPFNELNTKGKRKAKKEAKIGTVEETVTFAEAMNAPSTRKASSKSNFSLIKWATKFTIKRPKKKTVNAMFEEPDVLEAALADDIDPLDSISIDENLTDFLKATESSSSHASTASPPTKVKPIKPKVARVKKPQGDTPKPSLSLLQDEAASSDTGFTEEDLQLLAHLVEQRLLEFGVEVKVVHVHPGPVITRFELDLAAGIKVSKITGLAKDLARSLSVVSVRVVEVIPGKSTVGLEIPNANREVVRLKDVLVHDNYQQASSPLSLGLGKDISGRPVIVDLARMPHLLVAGTTGSGKSVGINAMLMSVLYKASPEEVRLILIDPKMLELAVYHDIPHLLAPVVTDMKEATNALKWCVAEMERRYQLMAAVGVRNLTGLNQKIHNARKNRRPIMDPLWNPQISEKPDELEHMPYIVVVVDEFADMIMVLGKKAEELIARIAQKARAAGIHLIIATQRPSVDVITGLIKANIPTRIAFQVSSKIDSRTILDQMGAEQLLGQGDMLYLPPGVGVPHRIHGAFVADEEVHSVCDQLRLAASPQYVDEILSTKPNALGAFGEEDELDELFDDAVMIVTESRKASISLIQRRLKIGYNRAARLVEQMEAHGIVSAVQSNGMREVLAGPAPG